MPRFIFLFILLLAVSAGAQAPTAFNPNATQDTLLTDTLSDVSPSIWAGPDGFWAAAWQKQQHLAFSTSTDDGATWEVPRFLQESIFSTFITQRADIKLSGNDSGELMIVWEFNNKDVLYFIASSDFGETWTQPSTVVDGNNVLGFDLKATNDGTWILLWSDIWLPVSPPVDEYDIHIRRSTNLGQTWSPPALIHPIAPVQSGDDYHPRLVTDNQGNWMAVWESQSSLNGTIVAGNNIVSAFSSDDGTTWSATYPVNSSATVEGFHDIYDPTIASDGMGQWVVLWNERVDSGNFDTYRIFAATTDIGPESWTTQHQVSIYNDRNNESPFVKYIGNGKWCAVWSYLTEITPNPSRGLAYSTSTDPANSWTNQIVTYSDFIGPQVFANTADTNTSGTMIAVTTLTGLWQDRSENRYGLDDDLFFTRTDDVAQSWSDLKPLNIDAGAAPADDLNPSIASAGSTMISVWQRNENPSGPTGGDVEVVYSRSTDSGANWSAPAYLNNIEDSTAVNDVQPKVLSDGNGVWLAAWTGNTGGKDTDLLFRRSTDDGQTWGVIAQLSTDLADPQFDTMNTLRNEFNVDLATDGEGNWVAVWDVDLDSAVILSRRYSKVVRAFSSDNGVSWSSAQLIDSRFEGSHIDNVYAPQIEYGHGAWLVTWYTTESLTNPDDTDLDVYVARSVDNGHSWSPSVPVKPNTNDVDTGMQDARPSIATDGLGNWLIAWASHDFLSGTIGFDMDILAISSTDDGLTWSDPEPVNRDAATDAFIDGDAQGGVKSGFNGTNFFVVWSRRDPGAASPDWDLVYASRSDASGGGWGSITPLNRNADFDTGDDRNVAFAPVSNAISGKLTPGRLTEFLAIWESNDPAGGLGEDLDLFSTTFTPAVSTGAREWVFYE